MTGPEPHPPVRQEPDSIHTRAIVLAFVAATLLGAAMVFWGALELRGRVRALRPEGPTAAATPSLAPGAPHAVGGGRQTLIGRDTSAAALADQKRRLLESYGWVDERRGVVRIPIERAMELVILEGGR